MTSTLQDNELIDCTGDVCVGDTITFTEAVFKGGFSKPKFKGTRVNTCKVLKDSYGAAKQQHTFTIEVIVSSGCDALAAGTKTTRKGRNIYRNGCYREPWADEKQRKEVLAEKHQRGDEAREARYRRKGRECEGY